MLPGRVVFAALLLVVVLAVQVAVLARLPLPGATPDLLLLAVVSLALAHGPGFGLVAGFAAGLGADLVPPADHAVGRWALVLTVVGYFAGLAQGENRRSAFIPLFVVAVSATASVLLYAGLGVLIDDPHITRQAVTEILPTAVLYDVVLSAFVVPGVLRLADRFEPDPMVRR